MPQYVYIDQTKDTLPLLDKELFYVNLDSILYSSHNQKDILQSLDEISTIQSVIPFATNESLVYPRFNIERSPYKIRRNPKINFLPNDEPIIDSFDLFDQRALELKHQSDNFDKIYLFWSGGIDSTLVLCSILKNFTDLSNFVVVLNQNSIDEYPLMYNEYIDGKINVVSTNDFFEGRIRFSHNHLYTSGEVGGPLISFDSYENFNNRYPGIYNKPWKNHVNELLKFFAENSSTHKAVITYKEILTTSKASNIDLYSVYEFLWWVNFNWGHDIDLISLLWNYQELDQTIDVKRFLEQNCFFWYNSQSCQNWALSLLGQDLMIRDNIQKFIYKTYIYEFNKDSSYFKYKNKEVSTPKNRQMYLNKKILAIDTEYKLYYR
jgi:hypothetical protein